jgi:hypothetical protein
MQHERALRNRNRILSMTPFGYTFEELGWMFAAAAFLLFAIVIVRLSGRRNHRRDDWKR